MPIPGIQKNKKTLKQMKTRAELLAEIEENRLESNRLQQKPETLSISEPAAADGYNPYDHPGQPKEVADDADITERRRKIFLRNR